MIFEPKRQKIQKSVPKFGTDFLSKNGDTHILTVDAEKACKRHFLEEDDATDKNT